jgi:hypothetical protein
MARLLCRSVLALLLVATLVGETQAVTATLITDGEPGFPIINGGERYRLFAPGGQVMDPQAGEIPTSGTLRDRAYQRVTTDAEEFTVRTNPRLEASPAASKAGPRARAGP